MFISNNVWWGYLQTYHSLISGIFLNVLHKRFDMKSNEMCIKTHSEPIKYDESSKNIMFYLISINQKLHDDKITSERIVT